jgi:hypothetical protein
MTTIQLGVYILIGIFVFGVTAGILMSIFGKKKK